MPVGALSAAVLLDVAGRDEADAALAVGVPGALPAAATGLADWRYFRGEQRRIGTAHALLNTAGLVFHLGSLRARRRGRRGRGKLLLLAGYALNGLAAHLGGQLSFGLAVRVNQTHRERPPGEWTDVSADDLGPEELRRVEADGARSCCPARARGLRDRRDLQPPRRPARRGRARGRHGRLPVARLALRPLRRLGRRRPGGLRPAALRDPRPRGADRGRGA